MLISCLRRLIKLYRKYQLRQLYSDFYRLATIGPFLEVKNGAILKNESGNPSRINIGHHCSIYGLLACKTGGLIQIGNYSSIQDGVSIQCLQQVTIGSFTAIAGGTVITDNNTHPTGIEDWIAHRIRISPGGPGYPGLGNGWELSESAPVSIGDGVWVGTGSAILKGVSIGDGAIIARGSVVTKDVEPYTIVAGNPARKVKDRPMPERSIDEIAAAILN